MEEADKTEESAEDMTAAETEPSPKKAINGGVKYCKTMGKIIRASSSTKVVFPPFQAVSSHSESKIAWLLSIKRSETTGEKYRRPKYSFGRY